MSEGSGRGRGEVQARGESKPSREDRLAAALRENLRRRKAQVRAREARGRTDDEAGSKPGGG